MLSWGPLGEPDPLRDENDDYGDDDEQQQQGLPSRLFSLKSKLPRCVCFDTVWSISELACCSSDASVALVGLMSLLDARLLSWCAAAPRMLLLLWLPPPESTQDYPDSATALPLTDIDGPLGKHDPAHTAFQAHLAAAAAAQQQEMAGAGGYIWQLAGAAKDWIDENLPADVGSRRAGEVAGSGAAAAAAAAAGVGVQGLMQGIQGLGVSGVLSNSNNNRGIADNSCSSSDLPWLEKEEVDLALIDRANAEAAAENWRAWAVADEDSPFGAASTEDGQAQGDSASAAAAAGGVAAAAAGPGVGYGGLESSRGRWDYTVGLVGKPSAGKSTFYNAVIGEAAAGKRMYRTESVCYTLC
jgi:hypothetical protein